MTNIFKKKQDEKKKEQRPVRQEQSRETVRSNDDSSLLDIMNPISPLHSLVFDSVPTVDPPSQTYEAPSVPDCSPTTDYSSCTVDTSSSGSFE